MLLGYVFPSMARDYCQVERTAIQTPPPAEDTTPQDLVEKFEESRTYPNHPWLDKLEGTTTKTTTNPAWVDSPASRGQSYYPSDFPREDFEITTVTCRNGSKLKQVGDQIQVFDANDNQLGSFEGSLECHDGALGIKTEETYVGVTPNRDELYYTADQGKMSTYFRFQADSTAVTESRSYDHYSRKRPSAELSNGVVVSGDGLHHTPHLSAKAFLD